jgi:hypothetical protein
MLTQTITVYDLSRFEKKLATLNKKIARMGLGQVKTLSVQDEVKVVKNRFLEDIEVFSHFKVEISVPEEDVQLPGGWQLVGVIDHFEGLVKSVPETPQPPHGLHYHLERGAVCDHCGNDRNRKETFVVYSPEGNVRFVQVGRQCLGQFLGITPEQALGQVEVVKELLDEEEWLGERQSLGTHLGFFLSHVAAMVRTAGWRSASAAKVEGTSSTVMLTWNNIFNEEMQKKDRYGLQLWADRTPADKELAERVAAWLRSLDGRAGLNDYMSNLAQIGRNGFVTEKSGGFAASAVSAYLREQEQEIKRAAERAARPESHYVGEVKERLSFERLHLVKSFGYDTEWGYYFTHKFLDEAGNVLVWKTAKELDQGCDYAVRATVKAHEEYKGEKQTVLTLAKTSKR